MPKLKLHVNCETKITQMRACVNSGHDSYVVTWHDDVTPVSVSSTASVRRHYVGLRR